MIGQIQREFLGWQKPLLNTAVDWLSRRYGSGRELDLASVIVVVPGRRAGRRLLELLVLRAEADGQRLIPPSIETLGTLPERLYPLQQPLADDLAQQLTWMQALREVDRKTLMAIVPHPPEPEATLAWWAIARLLWSQHRELAADGLDFADVLKFGNDLPGFTESDRWAAMHTIQKAYLRSLDGLGLWDVQTARLIAIRQREPRSDRDLVLIGTVDMNQATRRILDLVAETSPPGRVTALVAAPTDRRSGFDSHGCLIPKVWSDSPIEVPDSDIRMCDGATEQAEQVAAELARFDGRYRADEIVVGLADERLGSLIVRALSERDVSTRWIEGTRIADSGPSRLLLALAEVLERARFEDFAAFVRHSDLADWLRRNSSSGFDLAQLDQTFRDHLPLNADELESLLNRRSGSPSKSALRAGLQIVRELLAPWTGPARRLSEWAEPMLNWLRTIYGDRVVDDSTPEGRIWPLALSELSTVARDIASLPQSIAPVVSASDAIRCAVQRLSEKFVPPEADSTAIELLGWLELSLDDTPAAIVTSFNEGFVPTSLNSDLFLPNELRRRLGVIDNARRYARDAYAVTVLRESRRDVRWLIGRRDIDNRPLIPSRLLFATQPDRLAERVLKLLDEKERSLGDDRVNGVAWSGELSKRSDEVPCWQPPAPEQIARLIGAADLLKRPNELTLNVTEFRSYLACRYRYFLKHVLKLRSVDDDAVELDGMSFGIVLHEVLQRFGGSASRRISDEARLHTVLSGLLDDVANERFGSRRRAAVNVQLAQMQSRLDAFASWQANWRRKGWLIQRVEWSVRPEDREIDSEAGLRTEPTFRVDGIPVWLHGRIDRLDQNEKTGDWALFDYKSGDRGDEPEKLHRKRNGEWIDLQLPLYRHLARAMSLDREPQLGYINLPKELNDTGARFARWTAEDLMSADKAAERVAQQIAARDFWPPRDPAPNSLREFDDLCQVGVFGTTISLPRGESADIRLA